jgi:beta-glucosidase
MGGGSAQVAAHDLISPLEGIKNRVGDSVQVDHAIRCYLHRMLPNIENS